MEDIKGEKKKKEDKNTVDSNVKMLNYTEKTWMNKREKYR